MFLLPELRFDIPSDDLAPGVGYISYTLSATRGGLAHGRVRSISMSFDYDAFVVGLIVGKDRVDFDRRSTMIIQINGDAQLSMLCVV